MWAKQKGFTIVELLIVIVVIAILAAITIVAYNGIQARAKDSAHRQEIAQAERGVMTQSIIGDTQETGVSGRLIGYSERSGATSNEVKLIRPVSGTPDLTLYMACSNTTAIDSTFTSSLLLRPSSTAANIRFQSIGGGAAGMGFRIDTSAETNITEYEDGIRTVGADYVGWLEISNTGRTVTFNYNTAAQNQVVTLAAHTGWSFDRLMVGGESTCTKTVGLIFDTAHNQSTRQTVMDWLQKRLNLTI